MVEQSQTRHTPNAREAVMLRTLNVLHNHGVSPATRAQIGDVLPGLHGLPRWCEHMLALGMWAYKDGGYQVDPCYRDTEVR